MNWKCASIISAVALPVLLIVGSCQSVSGSIGDPDIQRSLHRQEVMTSAFCGSCHPAMYAEHNENTHGRAFTDEEVRLATGRFSHGDCIRCHTPRPIFEAEDGREQMVGMNPIRRYHNLTEGNTCMTCHQKADHDYGDFMGGAECTTAFDNRVGAVEACAACHRNHGTPYQWELAQEGKKAGRVCITCHMPMVNRPVALGERPRAVRSHVFPGARSTEQVRKAYSYEARIEDNEVVVTITNTGVGHNFPTELKQRAAESLIIVRNSEGEEVSRSRMVFRDPYKRPYGLHLPVNTQIPSGESRTHRVPIKVADGSVDCEFHFKHYFPIEDHHPDLAQMLESKRLIFSGVEPSTKEVISAPEVAVVTAESISIGDASPANLVDFARPPIGTVEVDIPSGSSEEDITKLIGLFQFPVPQANRDAQAQLVSIGLPAVPQLITALGDWDNKTFNQALSVLERIGDPALPLVLDALNHEELYVRYNSRVLIGRMKGGRFTGLFERRADGSGMVDPRAQRRELAEAMVPGLSMSNALDRRSAAEAIASLWVGEDAPPELRTMLKDVDPDVVVAAADALSHLGVTDAIPELEDALLRAFFVETRRDLAVALAGLGSTAGIQDLFTGMDHEDDLIRESMFESFFAVTGLYFGYDPFAPRHQRLAAISDLQAYWAESGGPEKLRKAFRPDPGKAERAWSLVKKLNESGLATNQAADARVIDELVSLRKDALPALFAGLKYPAGFAGKLALVCDTLALIGDRDAAPFLAAMLRSPVIAVTIRAAQALEKAGDAAAIPALIRYRDRIHSVEARGELPPQVGSKELILAAAARTRLLLGDDSAREELIELLLCDVRAARAEAIQALAEKYGEARGFDPDASAAERQAAVRAWQAR